MPWRRALFVFLFLFELALLVFVVAVWPGLDLVTDSDPSGGFVAVVAAGPFVYWGFAGCLAAADSAVMIDSDLADGSGLAAVAVF